MDALDPDNSVREPPRPPCSNTEGTAGPISHVVAIAGLSSWGVDLVQALLPQRWWGFATLSLMLALMAYQEATAILRERELEEELPGGPRALLAATRGPKSPKNDTKKANKTALIGEAEGDGEKEEEAACRCSRKGCLWWGLEGHHEGPHSLSLLCYSGSTFTDTMSYSTQLEEGRCLGTNILTREICEDIYPKQVGMVTADIGIGARGVDICCCMSFLWEMPELNPTYLLCAMYLSDQDWCFRCASSSWNLTKAEQQQCKVAKVTASRGTSSCCLHIL